MEGQGFCVCVVLRNALGKVVWAETEPLNLVTMTGRGYLRLTLNEILEGESCLRTGQKASFWPC